MLTERTGLNGQVTFQWGNALEMPFADSIFDVAWTQFAGMNIEDKPRFYSECRRILKDGGRLAFQEVMAEAGGKRSPTRPWIAGLCLTRFGGRAGAATRLTASTS